MQASNAPSKVPLPFANAGAKNTIPTASQIGVTPGAASLTDGFPPLTRTPVAAGGIPPSGLDMNGILNLLSANIQWENAGGFFPYDATFSTAIGGYPKGAVLLRADGAGFWVSTADNNATNPDAGGAGWIALLSGSFEAARVQGLLGQNNAGTPNTQFDFSALSVTLRNPTTGATAVVVNTGALTNNVLSAGPVANGRDQAGAFAASQWLRFYFIWNPTTSTIATISSVNNPALGPALPSGYTHWAYIGSVYLSSSSILAGGNFRGSRFSYSSLMTALSGGTSTGLVAVSVANLVPPEAGWFELFFQSLAITASAGGAYNINCQIVTQATQIFNIGLTGGGTASVIASVSGPSKQVTNFGQSFAYQLTVGAGAGPAVTIDVPGYSVPNGGE